MNIKRCRLIVWGIMFLSLLGNIPVWGETTTDVLDYYPIKQGNRWTYQQIYLKKVQQKIELRVGMPEGGLLKLNYYTSQTPAEPTSYFMKSQFLAYTEYGLFLDNEMGYLGDATNYSPPLPLIMADMTPGSTWTWESEEQKRKETTKVLATEAVTIMGKTFDSIVIQTNGTQNYNEYSMKKWYVKHIGLVKQVSVDKGKTLTLELVDYIIKTL